MQKITPEWLRERLGNERGARAALSDALGLKPDQISKMLAGTRKPQADEVPAILAFFGEHAPSVDPELAAVWSELKPSERMLILNLAKAQIDARRRSQGQSDEEDG